MVKILDLGVARLCEGQTEGMAKRPALTQLGVVMGTADYMAPEQARDSREADARSDIYSLGCTLYFALTGGPPFPGGNAIEKMLHHQLDEPTPIESLRPDVPPGLAAVLRHMMAKKQAERYQHAGEVLEALGPFCVAPASGPMPVPVVVSPTVVNGPAGDTPLVPVVLRADMVPHRGAAAFNPWVWVAAASALAGAAVVVILLVRLLNR
jgi:serine/threonine-protein kinase